MSKPLLGVIGATVFVLLFLGFCMGRVGQPEPASAQTTHTVTKYKTVTKTKTVTHNVVTDDCKFMLEKGQEMTRYAITVTDSTEGAIDALSTSRAAIITHNETELTRIEDELRSADADIEDAKMGVLQTREDYRNAVKSCTETLK